MKAQKLELLAYINRVDLAHSIAILLLAFLALKIPEIVQIRSCVTLPELTVAGAQPSPSRPRVVPSQARDSSRVVPVFFPVRLPLLEPIFRPLVETFLVSFLHKSCRSHNNQNEIRLLHHLDCCVIYNFCVES